MKAKSTLLLLIFYVVANIQGEVPNIIIANKDDLVRSEYTSDLLLSFIINPSDANKMVFEVPESAFDVIDIYCDEIKMVPDKDDYDIEFDETNSILAEPYQRGTIRLTYSKRYKLWSFLLMPGGYRSDAISFRIPSSTRKVQILYRIVFPDGTKSEPINDVILIRDLNTPMPE